ncbi:MAG: tRNA 2-thiocytidine(32) synthetase TtcA [Myxococcales bacterium]|nr:tRNA 2-thiocytidine(32) synthetase TtcA [Myxococcales bacterium]
MPPALPVHEPAHEPVPAAAAAPSGASAEGAAPAGPSSGPAPVNGPAAGPASGSVELGPGLERRLYRQMKKTCEDYELLAPGDRILVAVSGGKDSYCLLRLLGALVKRVPFEASVVAVHLDQKQPGYDGKPLADWLAQSGFEYEILSEDTYSVVVEHVEQGGTYCSLCSRLRRGVLYGAAERLGCNKIALGHHREDALETFLMNLFYGGKLQSMPPKYLTDDGRFEVIRPLIQCDEPSIAALAKQLEFPILPCNLCGSQPGLKRDRMAELLTTLEAENPHVKSVMMAALANVCPTHLLDRDVQRAWAERDPEIPAKASLAAGKPRATGRQLPVL